MHGKTTIKKTCYVFRLFHKTVIRHRDASIREKQAPTYIQRVTDEKDNCLMYKDRRIVAALIGYIEDFYTVFNSDLTTFYTAFNSDLSPFYTVLNSDLTPFYTYLTPI
jgi:hypothetical protein